MGDRKTAEDPRPRPQAVTIEDWTALDDSERAYLAINGYDHLPADVLEIADVMLSTYSDEHLDFYVVGTA